MSTFLSGLLLSATLFLLVPAGMLLVEVLASLVPARSRPASGRRAAGVEILIPAHDEEQAIGGTIAAIRAQMLAMDRLVVIVDNCADRTADIARAAGAEVVERVDKSRHGKGYALAAGLAFVKANEPRGIIVFIDADCTLTPHSLDELFAASQETGGPVQARDTLRRAARRGAFANILEFAWRVRNDVRPRGAMALGLPCHLMGTGMAIPLRLLDDIDLATGHVAEDLQLGLQLTAMGHPPHFCGAAEVTSQFAPTDDGRQVQKQRWVHGHLASIVEHVPKLVRTAWRRRDAKLLAVAADLSIPPLALLGVMQVLAIAASALLALATGRTAALATAAIGLLASGTALAAAWWQCGRDIVRLVDLAGLPTYIGRQLLSGLLYIGRRRSTWARSQRS